MSGFDFRVLIKNQWIIVCSLVGLVALCTTMVDVFTGKFGSSPSPQTANNNQTTNNNQTGNQVTPQPQAASKPKHGRQWVLDSTGAGDADAKDFAPIVNSLRDGDTVQVKAGSYNGPVALAKSVVITGDTDQKTGARASIRYSGTGCVITGSQVTLQNLDVSETSEGGIRSHLGRFTIQCADQKLQSPLPGKQWRCDVRKWAIDLAGQLSAHRKQGDRLYR